MVIVEFSFSVCQQLFCVGVHMCDSRQEIAVHFVNAKRFTCVFVLCH